MMAIAHYNSLGRFPTWVWIRDDGYTLVLDAPGDSYVFYTLQFPIDRLLAYPLCGLAVLFVDALILFCMYAVARRPCAAGGQARHRSAGRAVARAVGRGDVGRRPGTTKRDAGGRMSAFNKRGNLLFTIGLSAPFSRRPPSVNFEQMLKIH